MEYLGRAIDILTCYYTELGSGIEGHQYDDTQILWALEQALMAMGKLQELESEE